MARWDGYVKKTNTTCGHMDRKHAAGGMCNNCYLTSRRVYSDRKRRLTDIEVVDLIGLCHHANPTRCGTTVCEQCYRSAWKRLPDIRQKSIDQERKRYAARPAIRRQQAREVVERRKQRDPHGHIAMTRNSNLKKLYGITQSRYEEMEAQQGGKCAICEGPPGSRKNLDVDHDHATREVRGLLCHPCNTGIGQLKERPVILLRAIGYILKHRPRINVSAWGLQ